MRIAEHQNMPSQEAVETLPMKILKTQVALPEQHAIAEGWLETTRNLF